MAITSHFYNGSLRKLIIAFGTLFNNITVVRDEEKIISVPLVYASKEKFYLTLKQNYSIDKITSTSLPRMGFIISSVAYDFERKQSSIAKFHSSGASDSAHKKMFMPVPYDINITLSIYSKNMMDSLQVLEQILPFFKPSFNITIDELSEMGVMRDIPIVLDDISHDDTTEGDVADGFRLLTWDLSFTIKANFYGPVREQKIIKHVYVDFHTSTDGEYNEEVDERYYVDVDPSDAEQTGIWDYNEEIFPKGSLILSPEVDVLLRNNDGVMFLGDSCSCEII